MAAILTLLALVVCALLVRSYRAGAPAHSQGAVVDAGTPELASPPVQAPTTMRPAAARARRDAGPTVARPSKPEFDDRAKRCYLAAFEGFEFPTRHDFEFKYAYPLCLYPLEPGEQTDAGR